MYYTVYLYNQSYFTFIHSVDAFIYTVHSGSQTHDLSVAQPIEPYYAISLNAIVPHILSIQLNSWA